MSRALGLVLILALAATVQAQETFGAAGAAAPLEATGSSARALGMGGAFVGLADDAASLYFNPAGLGLARRAELAFHHHSWLVDVVQQQMALQLPMGKAGGLGMSASYLDLGVFEGRDDQGRPSVGYTGSRVGGGLAWGYSPGAGFSSGLGVKGFSQTLAQAGQAAFSADLGLLWEPRRGTRLGLSYMNLGTSLGGAALAAPLQAGVSQAWGKSDGPSLLLAASGGWETSGVSRLAMGAELGYLSVLALRAGYRLDLAPGRAEGLSGLSLGAGFVLRNGALDYAWLPQGVLGDSHRLSLSWRFGTEAQETPRAASVGAIPAPASPASASSVSAGQVQPQLVPSSQARPDALNLRFSLPPDRVARARDLEAQGNRSQAIQELNLAVREAPADAKVWRALGEAYERAGRLDYAAQCLRQAHTLKPDPRLESWLKENAR